jgi:hypothetical protein
MYMKAMTLLFSMLMLISCNRRTEKAEPQWVSLFNGKDLTGWDIKITKHSLNDNYGNLFRVENGILKVSYDQIDSFRGQFGHLYYKQKFSTYKLRVEYRFTGEQCPGGPEWGIRNSGIMFHSQSAASMELNQDFPVSIEAQFLGGLGKGERPTLSVCTPGTDVDILGIMAPDHCTSSSSKTFDGDQWVTAEIDVYGDSIIYHLVNGDTVMTYTKPRVGPSLKPEGYPVPDGTPLKDGYFALQAESTPVEFRKVEIMDLSK